MATQTAGQSFSTGPTRSPLRGGWLAAWVCVLALLAGGTGPAHGQESDSASDGQASYLRLHPDFVVNLQGSGRSHFLLASIDVMARDPEALAAAKHHSGAIRHELVLLLSDQRYDAVNTADGRQALQRAALDAVNGVLEREHAAGPMLGLFFSNFVAE